MNASLIVRHVKALAQTTGNLELARAAEMLCAELDAVEVKIQDQLRDDLHGGTLFQNAVERGRYLVVRYELNAAAGQAALQAPPPPPGNPEPGPADLQREVEMKSSGEQGSTNPPGTANGREAFIREFDKRERANRFMWAGFVVNELLPQLGFVGAEAKRFLKRLEAEGIVATVKEPNPRNPDFPTTRVLLNREHPVVRQVLSGGPLERFRPIDIAGGPLSEDIIRDRR